MTAESSYCLQPETANPLPEIEAALMVRAMLPDELSVTDCVVEEFSCTVPKLRLDELTARPAIAALSCRAALADDPLADAVMLAVCAVVTAEAVAVNDAELDPLATVTEAGTETALLLLARLTDRALVGAEVRVRVQASETAPVSELLLQETALGVGGA